MKQIAGYRVYIVPSPDHNPAGTGTPPPALRPASTNPLSVLDLSTWPPLKLKSVYVLARDIKVGLMYITNDRQPFGYWTDDMT